MVTTTWTHPKHKIPAAVALFFSLGSCALVAVSIFVTPLFCDHRAQPDNCSFFFDQNVECSLEVCKSVAKGDHSEPAWRIYIEYTWVISFVTSTLTVLLQLLFFWPLVFFGKVLNFLLIIVYVLEFISGFLKAFASFGLFYVTPKINHKYAWFEPKAVQIDTLPGGLCLFSMIFSFLSAMMLLVATDVGPRGQEPYMDTIHRQEEQQERFDRLSRTPSVFLPTGDTLVKTSSTGSTEL